MSPALAAKAFCGLVALVILFQLALAAGVPWGAYAMGGAFPGAFPPPMRVAALVQAVILAAVGAVVLARAGLALPRWGRASRGLAWVVVAFLGVGVILNLITPSGMERAIWAPVAILLFALSLRVALSR